MSKVRPVRNPHKENTYNGEEQHYDNNSSTMPDQVNIGQHE